MTEYRYVVTEIDFGNGYDYVIAKVAGKRANKRVKVARTPAVKHRAQLTVEQWDMMPKTESGARQAWIAFAERRVKNTKEMLESRQRELAEARAIVDKLEVKELR